MPIKPTINAQDVDAKVIEKARAAAILKLSYIGEVCVKDARLKGSYTDRTGNLRSSVGYVIVVNGKVVKSSDFGTVKDGKTGSKDGKEYADSLVHKYSTGIALIVVAGMNYAAYVQRRGYNVLASAELIAQQMLRQLNVSSKVTSQQ